MTAPLRNLLKDYSLYCVGSLPYRDAERAVDFVLSRPEILPFWPELPQRSPNEEMLPRSETALKPDWHGFSRENASGLFALKDRLKFRKIKLNLLKLQLMGPVS